MFDCLYLSPKLKQNTTQTHFLHIKRVTNFKTHKSPPKRHDCNDLLKFVCQPKSEKYTIATTFIFGSIVGKPTKDMTGKHRVLMRSAKKYISELKSSALPIWAFPHRHTTIWHKILSSALVTTSTQLPNLDPLAPNGRHIDVGTRSVVLHKIIEIPSATYSL